MKSLKDRKSAVYLHLAAKTLFVLSGIILITSFVFILTSVPSIIAGNWENVFFVSRETHWKITIVGLFTMFIGMVIYIITFLISGKK